MKNNRGILLIEMVAVIGLLAVFMVVISGLFAASIHAERDSVRTDELVRRVDSAMGALRRDIWAAGAITPRGNQLLLTTGREQTAWDFQTDGTLVRTARQPQRQEWHGFPAAGVSVRGPLVTVTFGGAEPQTIVFASQLLLAERRP